MAKISMETGIDNPIIAEISVPYPNKKWFVHIVVRVVCTNFIVLLAFTFFHRPTIDWLLFRDSFCLAILATLLFIIVRSEGLCCINRVVFYQEGFDVFLKPIIYRSIKRHLYTNGLVVTDRRNSKHRIDLKYVKGGYIYFGQNHGWSDQQLNQIIDYLKHYEGVTIVQK